MLDRLEDLVESSIISNIKEIGKITTVLKAVLRSMSTAQRRKWVSLLVKVLLDPVANLRASGQALDSQLFLPIFSRISVRNCGFFVCKSAPLYLVSISQSRSVYLVSIMQQSQSAYLVSIAQHSYCISRVNYAAGISRIIDFIPILFQFCSNFVRFASFSSKFVPILFQLFQFCSNVVPILFQFCSNFVPILFQFCSNFVPILFQFCSNFVPILFRSDFLACLTACWFEKAV